MITDPIFLSSKLYKNGKFELELVSGKMARDGCLSFALDRQQEKALWEEDYGSCCPCAAGQYAERAGWVFYFLIFVSISVLRA